MLAGVHAFHGDGVLAALGQGTWQIVGAVVLGGLLGVPMSYLTGRIKPGEPTLVEAMGIVFLCGGIAIWANVSLLLAAMTLGLVVVNLAKHHERPFHAIEDIEWPFMILFFVLSGASLHVESLYKIGLIGTAYLLLRTAGRLAGARLGAAFVRSVPSTRRWMGLALMPQAGVALGMALVATQHFPQFAEMVLTIAIVSTVVFEIIGPLCTRRALAQSGEVLRRTSPERVSQL